MVTSSFETRVPLHQQTFSLDHAAFTKLLTHTENLLIIQDLDGVCMGLVKDPLNREIHPSYVEAVTAYDGHFFVLTNGEHIGKRGINGIIEKALGKDVSDCHLPGLAAGGVQWQDRYGQLNHPGVSDDELIFLQSVPNRITTALREFLNNLNHGLSSEVLNHCINASVLDNVASPTANLNTFYEKLANPALYQQIQEHMKVLMDQLLTEAVEKGLGDSFFVHYAPNLGRNNNGDEAVWWANETTSGTTDFQFMLRGAIKEAGVLALLNRYYFKKIGVHPLGIGFNARQAPRTMDDMLALVKQDFDPAHMPLIIGVGDTVTSQAVETEDGLVFQRGGSDRNFLQLIQNIGHVFNNGNLVAYVDSSGGELKNRRPVQVETQNGISKVTQGPGDPRDNSDPLKLNVVFPGGHQQYCQIFETGAHGRRQL
ncbi:glucosylglycerol 3-phosphatase [Leptolyngbyaceae cyanobacterium CCMR0082]|uniref:Glucosylglycerol 3-phosphatase n=2 Tax=Adonisia turfae TaxID=2950184 RepID=A0A6M0S0A5_9CYAN|nr:glucosylglycerol 3-phosphatase [Adonisia turfae]NEZ58895.1 glucosylglycerol 3-phosphatase [Adonisia turfae CCMR0081]NEZ61887.1 glucosylglycerol 3-phosphatase [Adonisia turfae CCMR0082]